MPSHYTVSQAAQLLGTSPTTTRRLADEFADHLPDYQPEKGVARKLSDGDLRTIYAIQSRLQATPALTRAALLTELSTPGSEPIVTPASLPTPTAQEGQGSSKPAAAIAEALPLPQNAVATFLQSQANIERNIETLSAAIAEIQSRPAPARQGIPAPFVLVSVGIVFVSIIAAALVWPMAGLVGLSIVGAVLVWGMYASMRR